MSTPEGAVLAAILEYLKLRHVYAFRMNTGAGKLLDGARHTSRFVRFGFPGCSDILGILDDGRFLAIEVKGPKGKATFEQLDFLAEIAKRGGVAFIAHSIEDVERHLFQPGGAHAHR
jgi:hypothetical protein